MMPLKETSDGVFMVEERELEENSQYLFHVMVSNDVGEIQSTPVQIGIDKINMTHTGFHLGFFP